MRDSGGGGGRTRKNLALVTNDVREWRKLEDFQGINITKNATDTQPKDQIYNKRLLHHPSG